MDHSITASSSGLSEALVQRRDEPTSNSVFQWPGARVAQSVSYAVEKEEQNKERKKERMAHHETFVSWVTELTMSSGQGDVTRCFGDNKANLPSFFNFPLAFGT